MDVGIDHLAVYVPNQYISMENLAVARNVDPNKFKVGLGIMEMAVPLPSEDVVVMAANAGKRVLEEAKVSPAEIGLLIVGTESANDRAKPTATHVHELLGISHSCRVYDVMHACAGATYGVLSALDWLQNIKNKYALVIASDIAWYEKESLGEPTQGAGAVAILLTRNPRLMALQEVSAYSKNVYDFWKPWNREYPFVDGVYSAQCYLEAVEQCFRGQEIEKAAAFLYHTPYPKLVKHAHAKVTSIIDPTMDGEKHYRDRVAGSSIFSSRIGNVYTASLWLSLVSYLENSCVSGPQVCSCANEGVEEQHGCYLFSYGSGCGAVLMRSTLCKDWFSMTRHFHYTQILDKRKSLDFNEYEQLRAGKPIEGIDPQCSNFIYEGLKNEQRQYISTSSRTRIL